MGRAALAVVDRMLNSLWVEYCLFCSLVWLDNEKGRGERVTMSMLHVCNGFWIVFSYVFFWRDILFPQLNSLDGSSEIGMISKQWTGLAREMFTDAENFGVRCKDRTEIFSFEKSMQRSTKRFKIFPLYTQGFLVRSRWNGSFLRLLFTESPLCKNFERFILECG